jgi:hypothetical protein
MPERKLCIIGYRQDKT